MTDAGLLDGDQIRALLTEVAGELAKSSRSHTIVVAGGSLLAWYGLRDATADIDSTRRIDDELRGAARAVAARHHLAIDWLNDHAAAWTPATFTVAACPVLVEHPHLLVLGMPLRDVFLMKLNRALPADLDDMRRIWPYITEQFASAAEVIAAYQAAFPFEPNDEHLGQFVVTELAKGGVVLSLT